MAATQPPHLAAINPWEGLSDMYREFAFHGGIPETFFSADLAEIDLLLGEPGGRHAGDDEGASLVRRVLGHQGGRLLEDQVPAFVVASWSDQGLHLRGTLEAFNRISSRQKWLVIHGRKKWENYHQPDNVESSEPSSTASSRESTARWRAGPRCGSRCVSATMSANPATRTEWPLARTRYTKLFLDARSGTLENGSRRNPRRR